MPRFLFAMTNLDWEGPAIGGKELKGPFETVDLKRFFDLSRKERKDLNHGIH